MHKLYCEVLKVYRKQIFILSLNPGTLLTPYQNDVVFAVIARGGEVVVEPVRLVTQAVKLVLAPLPHVPVHVMEA